MKSWLINCEVNACPTDKIKMIVKSNTERDARSFAINDLYKQGYFHVNILSCKEIKQEEYKNYE